MEEAKYVRLRTTVVVASMLILPALAVIGVKSPGTLLGAKKSDTAAAQRPAPREQPSTSANPTPETPPAMVQQPAAAARADVVQAGGASTLQPARVDIQLAGANIDVPASSTDPENRGNPEMPLSFASPSTAGEVIGGSSQNVAAAEQPLGFAATTGQIDAPSSAAGLEQFTLIQQRLRALGATHYALETWGSDGQLYRFQCRMAAGHSVEYTRLFEATDTDALRTMQTVLGEVEAWKEGRLP